MANGRLRGRRDANHAELVGVARVLGASVLDLADVGSGCGDILLGILGRNVIVEIKDGSKPPSARRLAPQEVEFHESWRGEIAIVKSTREMIALVRRIQREERRGAVGVRQSQNSTASLEAHRFPRESISGSTYHATADTF